MHQVHLLQDNVKDMNLQVDVQQRSLARRLDTAISDRCYELLYKVQDLSGKLKIEKRNLVTLESTVREDLKKEFQAQISDLNSQLMVVHGQFAEYVTLRYDSLLLICTHDAARYRESLESDMKINLHDIRKEALMKMVMRAHANKTEIEFDFVAGLVVECAAGAEKHDAADETERGSSRRAHCGEFSIKARHQQAAHPAETQG